MSTTAELCLLIRMEIDPIHKLALGGAAVLGVVVTATKIAFENRIASRQHLKTELELLQTLETHVSQDPTYRDFVSDVRKEKLSSFIFGCPIPNAELGLVMEYYRRGDTTIREIGVAWPYRTLESNSLKFSLSGPQRLFLLFIHVYGFGCAFGGILCWIVMLAMPREQWPQQLELAAYSSIYLLITIAWYRSNRGVIIANRLSAKRS